MSDTVGEGEEGGVSHSLVPFPNVHHGWGRAGAPIWNVRMSRGSVPELSDAALPGRYISRKLDREQRQRRDSSGHPHLG